MKKRRRKRILWIIVLFWMAVIFMLSHQPAYVSNNTSKSVAAKLVDIAPTTKKLPQKEKNQMVKKINHTVRKSAHGLIYFALAILVLTAVSTRCKTWSRRWLWTVLICIIYAVSDELHQLFVPGRGCQLRDVAIDTIGAVLGIIAGSLIIALVHHIYSKYHSA